MNVSRETISTAYDIVLYMIATDYCWNNFVCYSYCEDCIHEVSTTMLAISIAMVIGGEY